MKTFNIKSLDWHKLLLYGVIIFLVLFYFSKCNNTPAPVITTTTKVLKDTLRLIEQDRKHLTDSFDYILKKREQQNYQNESDFIKLLNENAELSVINERLQREEVIPDTCKGIVKKYQDAYGNYEAQTNRTIEQAKKSLISLSGTIKDQKAYLAAKDEIYNRLKKVTDTCLANSAALEKYVKKIKPKRELGLMVSGMNDFSNKNLKLAVGGGLSYRNKRGLQFVVSYYSNKTGSISLIKPLARF